MQSSTRGSPWSRSNGYTWRQRSHHREYHAPALASVHLVLASSSVEPDSMLHAFLYLRRLVLPDDHLLELGC
jgi:hypothetical protein